MDWLILALYVVGSYLLVSFGVKHFWKGFPEDDPPKKESDKE